MGHKVNFDGQDYDFTPENTTVNLFRNRPDFAYTLYNGEIPIALFNPSLAHWLGGIALDATDQRDLNQAEREMGAYVELYGGNPRVIIDDDPNSDEIKAWAKLQSEGVDEEMKGIDDEWGNFGKS